MFYCLIQFSQSKFLTSCTKVNSMKKQHFILVNRNNSQGLAQNAVVAKVNDQMWDLDRPFEEDSSLELITFQGKDKDGNKVINSDAQV